MRSSVAAGLGVDLAVTALLCGFWLWFGWQYGFRNTPDSWYRGILAKSITEGHPFLVNIKHRAAFGCAAVLGRSRVIVVGHNFMADPRTYERQPALGPVLRSWLDWLLQTDERSKRLTSASPARIVGAWRRR